MTMNTNETAMAIAQSFILPNVAPTNGFSADDIGDDFDGLKLSFQRIKIPSGGTLQFEVPSDDPENPNYEKNITGIIICNHSTNAYWPLGLEYDENTPPLCSSFDGKIGHGVPSGACALCEMNQYGSDEGGGKGKACKNMRTLYILRSGDVMPIQLSLPPTSLSPYSDFMSAAFVTRNRPAWSAIVEIGLKKATNGTNTYSVATFKKVADLNAEQIPVIKEYALNFRTQIKELQQQRALETEGRVEPNGVLDTTPRYENKENGEHFEVTAIAPQPAVATATVNGDADGDLPF